MADRDQDEPELSTSSFFSNLTAICANEGCRTAISRLTSNFMIYFSFTRTEIARFESFPRIYLGRMQEVSGGRIPG
jgi:hypothetical protein